MTSAQLSEWLAYYLIEPFGPQQDELRAAQIAVASLTPRIRAGHRLGPGDIFPSLCEIQEKTPEEEVVRWLNWVASCGGLIKES